MRFSVTQVLDSAQHIEYGVLDLDVHVHGAPFIVRQYESLEDATAAASLLNSTRGNAANELRVTHYPELDPEQPEQDEVQPEQPQEVLV